ncbi:MAG: septum formation protein Maf [Bacteroidales bacterium]|jgi:septum formation protein|nr:septum formation protein Maf [Bacteroidales bacterium]MBQ2376238.1 septum formation protein Maf [Bacteroidales bacterium]MBQ2397199.1 septum formation protein Maf [Bacteroidales bacterium]MEE0266671.1 Maf family nucleotide pyrophosphatase [Bacteroidales bacterium]MEE0882551.1 Maf family nucleotide pyrophosphatase [Bacteroidales bacterium]
MSLSDLLSTKIILASKSPRRKQLLEQMGFEVVVDSVDIEETFPPNLDVEDVAEYLAIKKSKNYKKDVAEKSILVTSDTVVVVDNIILGKPKNVQEAKEFLRLLSSKTHKVITGCCLKTHNNKIKYFSEQTVVKFKELTEEEIDFYVNKYKPFDKAGAYGIQEWIGAIGIENIQGDYYNVVGFPCYKFFELAKEITE